jgi:phosphoribosyl 1,2-cyclic phosphodiesterase
VLATSSAGNCIFIGTTHTNLLIDAGLSRKETLTRLRAIGVSPESISAILVTHEHTDHVGGLLTLARSSRAPVYVSPQTAREIDWTGGSAIAAIPRIEHFETGSQFQVGDFRVQSFSIPHDAADPCGFVVETGGVRLAVAMDLGYIPENVRHYIREADLTVLESNHDLDMLKVGPYPWPLKQRVMSRKGHLSNDMAAEFILESMYQGSHTLMLGHLSEQNNHPEIARLVAASALSRRSMRTRLVVVEPKKQSEVIEF